MTGISLTLFFDEEEYRNIYPEASDEQLIRIFKEDFLDTIRKQYTDEDILTGLEVER